MDERVVVETLRSLPEEDVAALAGLLPQLAATATIGPGRLRAILRDDATELVVARRGGRIIGMATLVTIPLLSGVRGHVEDVVVDEAARGQGVARALLERVIALADERHVRWLDLTSRPSRESALRLYESVGFRRRETTVLRYRPS